MVGVMMREENSAHMSRTGRYRRIDHGLRVYPVIRPRVHNPHGSGCRYKVGVGSRQRCRARVTRPDPRQFHVGRNARVVHQRNSTTTSTSTAASIGSDATPTADRA